MKRSRHPAAFCLFALATLTCLAQTASLEAVKPKPQPDITPQPSQIFAPVNKMTVFLDPAHGGVDNGSRIGDSTLEKDVTLAFAFKLRSLLSARGFTVVMTRDADTASQPNASGSPLTLDDRAGIANHARPAACLLLHATGSGTGVHLYSSEIDETAGESPTQPWLTAQSAWVVQSQKLEQQLATAFTRSGIALVASSASVRPVDSLNCPALVVELAPNGSDPDTIDDAEYQQHIAEAIAGTMVFWPSQLEPPLRLTASPPVLNGAQP